MMNASDFRREAREALRGNWGKAVGVGFIATLLGASVTTLTGSGSGGDLSYRMESITEMDGVIPREFQLIVLAIISVITFVSFCFAILHFVIGGAVTLGYAKFNLNLLWKKPATFADLFSEFHRLGTAFLMQLLRGIYIMLWTLLLIIPGICATYSYAMTPYILLENPSMTANEAIAESKHLMYGNRFRLFCLYFSFIGWILLAALFTCGIGYLWLIPYMEASYAAFYREIKAEKYGREEKEEEPYEGFYHGSLV